MFFSKKIFLFSLIALLIFIFIVCFIILINIYIRGASSPFWIKLENIIPFPVASVNGSWISFAHFWKYWQIANLPDLPSDFPFLNLDPETKKAHVLQTLIENKIIRKTAKIENLEATKQEINRQLEKEFVGKNKEERAKTIQEVLKISEEDYIRYILIPSLTKQKFYQARIAPQSFDIWMKNKLKASKIRIFLFSFSWDKNTASIITK